MRNRNNPRKRRTRNPDRVTANQVDPVAYFGSEAFASLDDEIDNWARCASGMPFGGEDQPIRGFSYED